MNIKRIGVSLMIVVLLLGGIYVVSNNTSISNGMTLNSKELVETQSVEKENEIAICYEKSSKYEMYHKAISYIMSLDSALNVDMEYIAVNYKYEISNEDKQDIINALESYGVKVFESNLEELSDSEYSDEYGNLHGILITFEEIEVSEKAITISFSKYKSGMGSISTEISLIQKDNGEWEVKATDTPAIVS